jgi:predicted nucleotidyltransferase
LPIVHELPAARPLDADNKSLLRDLDASAQKLGIRYFVGGATARQVIPENIFGNRPGRRTYDIDIGVCVADWAEHEAFRQELVATERFRAVAKNPHRLTYHRGAERLMVLDVIPFGDFEKPAASIAWPPAMDTVMNVAGFREAFDFDMDIAAAALLTRDAAALARGSEAVTTQITAILADERVFRLLCEHMAFGDRQAVPGDSMDPRRVHARMEAFRAEFLISLEMKPSLPGAA